MTYTNNYSYSFAGRSASPSMMDLVAVPQDLSVVRHNFDAMEEDDDDFENIIDDE